MADEVKPQIYRDSHQFTNGTSSGHDHTYLSGCRYASNGDFKPGTVRSNLKATSSLDPIAICGLGIRLPGGIRNAEGFWDLLVNGKDAQGPIRSDRYKHDSFNNALGKKGAIKTERGYFLDDNLTSLDTSFFSMSKDELEKSDPQQRQLLEVTRECLESAGEIDYRGKLVGCYVGTFGEDWLQMSARETQHSGGYIVTGHGDLMISNRVSYEYDLRGPSMVIKTGCSASLIALHEACRALHSGDCSGAIVAGTSLIMGPATTAAMTQEGILSPEGSCKTFDAAADGFARAEAINAIYIKKLSDALRDNNPIRAIIRNTGTNSDGKSQGLMTPNSGAHETLIRKVYSDSGLIPSDTGYVECHGTGTPTGDPLETAAIGRVFGEKGVYIGSASEKMIKGTTSVNKIQVKPNVGHSEGASGITSLIKVILSLQHGTIPPNIKFSTPNPRIDFKQNGLLVPTKATPWPQDRSKRASINSFGIGGSNAHVILELPDAYVPAPGKGFGIDRPDKLPQLFVFSANTQDSLRRQVLNNTTYLEMHLDRVLDMAYTLSQHREHHVYRTFCTLDHDGSIGKAAVMAKVPTTTPDIVMVFCGQGAQWPTMGRELFLTNSEFRSDIEAMDSILQSLQYPPAWSIEDELFKTETSRIHRAELAQPLCTAIQIALVKVFRRSGIEPVAVVGHSSGEIAAAYAARAISFREALIISYYRGYVAKKSSSAGGMAAVGLGAAAVSTFLEDGVVIACENSPKSVTLSGDVEKLEKILAAIKKSKPDVLARTLKVDMAYHSHHMVSLGKEYRRLLEGELANGCDSSLSTEESSTSRHLDVLFFSSTTGGIIEQSVIVSPEYWQSNLTSPVRFDSAVRSMLQRYRNNLFLEIGPHSTLAGPLRQICSEVGLDCPYIPTMIRNKDCTETLLSAWGQLYQQGIPFSFEPLTRGGRVLADLPSYPWDHSTSYWYESRLSKEWRFREYGYHGLLGLRVGESTTLEPSWRNVLSLEDEPWLYDHKIRGDVIFPFSGYAAMAGECIRQVSGIASGYSLRHVVVHSALVLTDSRPVEMITALRPHRLTDSMDSDWFEFTISSYSSSTWMRNCVGQVKPRQADLERCENFPKYPREVTPSRWYAAMKKLGFNYGPEFSGLTKITSSTTGNLSVGEIENTYQEAPYVFHPTAIDACLQLLLVAKSKGIGRSFGHVAVPTRIEEIEVARSASTMSAKAGKLTESEAPGIDCVSEGRTCLRLRGVYLTPMDDEEDPDSAWDRHAAARLEWAPDFDFFDAAHLFKPPKTNIEETKLQEEIGLLCIVESAERLQGLETGQWHFQKYRDWLRKQVGRAQNGLYPVVRDCKQLVNLSSSVRRNLIEERLKQLSSTGSKAPLVIGIKRILDNIEALFTGKADALDVLMQENVLTKIYNASSFGHGDFVRMLSHTKPDLRVLEVGAGTGATTETILQDLVDKDGCPLYSLYSFTDVSAGFFPQAKERFPHTSNMEYKVFDITRDPIEQKFEIASYDLILAANVVHATPSLHKTLCNLRPLLRPQGHLVLTELCGLVQSPNYIFGNLPGWWLGEADGRSDEPYVSVDRWDQELKAAGFTGVDTAVFDAEQPYQYCAAIVSQPLPDLDGDSSRTTVTVLCDQETNEITRNLVAEIQSLGIDYSICKLGDRPPPGENIIATLDLESYFFENISENNFKAFQGLLAEQDHRTILWLTRPSQILCEDPRSAQTIGVARSIRSELSMSFVTLEIDPREKNFGKLVMQVFGKITSRKDNDNLGPDMEYAVDDGVIKVGRYHPFSLQTELGQKSSLPATNSAMTLEIMKPGLMQTFQWSGKAVPAELGEDEVEIQTAAVGLNFRDVLLAMGSLSYGLGGVPLGKDTTGVIRRVGSNVRNVKVGDRIFGLAPHGSITDRLVLPSSLAVKIPEDLSFEDAATMPCCFATAIHSLLIVGGMTKGQTILIHSASGGVGNAAIQICKMIGAEVRGPIDIRKTAISQKKVYATVGNDEKVEYLMYNLQLPRSHIFNSRDHSFLPDLMRETKGKGVDLVLNSLSGELLHTSWKCVAEFGKLIELGKRDIVGFGKLEMDIFEANRSYCCVDIAHLVREKPEQMARALEKCLELYQQGHVTPIRPLLTYEAQDATEAFRVLQNRDHIGKVILKLSRDDSVLSDVRSADTLSLDSRGSYLLAGGLGGLGRSIATWMVEHGARSLIFLSRSAGLNESDQAFFEELKSMGCVVSAVAGMTQNMEDVIKAISSAPGPIKGVIQLAMVLKDNPIVSMSYEDWVTVNLPKVDGTWNLHNALANQPLDFFFMSSSTVTTINQPGQGNYNAANTFLEAFCQYRHSLGLPASVLNICPIDDVGFVAEVPAARKSLKARGHYFLQEQDLLDYLHLSLLNSQPSASITRRVSSDHLPTVVPSWKNTGQIVMGLRSDLHPDDPNNRTHWRRDRRMGIYHNIKNTDNVDHAASDNQLKQFLSRCADDPDLLAKEDSEYLLAYEIGLKAFSLMLKDAEGMDTDMSLSAIGVDSLMAIELRRWWKRAFGLEISVLEIMGLGTIKELSKVTAQRLKVKLGGE